MDLFSNHRAPTRLPVLQIALISRKASASRRSETAREAQAHATMRTWKPLELALSAENMDIKLSRG